jgi:hypothetical protein
VRRSEASVALIRRIQDGQTLWLTQWNPKWKRFHFVSGHRHPEETFRECLVRELAEEIHLREGTDYTAGAEPLNRIEFTAFSESAQTQTQYLMALFEVDLIGDAQSLVDANPQNRWLSEAEIARERCQDGKLVSATILRILNAMRRGAGGEEPALSESPTTIRWTMPNGPPERIRRILEADLRELLAPLEPLTISISAIYSGFSRDLDRRIVLGVEVRTQDSFQTHIIKLGVKEEIEPDYLGWKTCVLSSTAEGNFPQPAGSIQSER